MPSIRLFKPRKKEEFAKDFRAAKATIFSEAVGRSTSIVPNIRSLSWSPTGALVATSTTSNIRIWNPERTNVRSSTEIRAATATSSIVEKLSFSPRHEALLASTGGDGICRLWDVRLPGAAATSGKGTCLSEASVGDTGLFLTWHPDGQELLVGRKDDEVQLVDIRRMSGLAGDIWETSVQDKTPKKDKGQFNGMAFSNSGRELFVTTGEGPVKILDWPSLEELHVLSAHSSATNVVQQSPAGTYVAVGGNDSMITLWDTTDWVCAQTITTQSSSVRDLSFSYDGSYVVASYGPDARDGSAGIHISHVESGEDALVYDTTNPVTWAAWHPWRHWLAYAGDPGGLKIISSLNM